MASIENSSIRLQTINPISTASFILAKESPTEKSGDLDKDTEEMGEQLGTVQAKSIHCTVA